MAKFEVGSADAVDFDRFAGFRADARAVERGGGGVYFVGGDVWAEGNHWHHLRRDFGAYAEKYNCVLDDFSDGLVWYNKRHEI